MLVLNLVASPRAFKYSKQIFHSDLSSLYLFFVPAYLSLGLRWVWHFEASEMSLPGQEPPRKL